MALSDESFATRTMARIRQLFGITNTSDLAAGPSPKVGRSIHYGMFSNNELRHVDGVIANPKASQITEMDIIGQLKDVSANSRQMMNELETLQMMAPEITLAETIIVSSIMSPTDLQTDLVNVAIDCDEISTETQTKINELLTNYFNDEFKLGPKLVDWLGTAGFHDGAKAIMILPQTEIDVLNAVADQWDPKYQNDFKDLRSKILGSTEGLQLKDSALEKAAIDALSEVACESLAAAKVGSDFMTTEEKKEFEEKNKALDKDGVMHRAEAPTSSAIAKDLMASSFKLLKPSPDGCGVIVTRDLSELSKSTRNANDVVAKFASEAERQIHGFKTNDKGNMNRPQFPVLSISDTIKTNKGDMPILIEFPADSVIPVCAPGDNKNHLGYFILIDEFGQPVKGDTIFPTESPDVAQRLATNAARSVFGNKNISSFQMAGMTEGQIMDNVTKTFSIAVNYLLKSKLSNDGLKGLNVNVHESVGKALFFNLLAKNAIKMVFVPEPMMVYYRFDHRPDGTGKSFLENIKYLLALRCTLMIAKVMAAIDNATKHRVIEVQVDDKNVNPMETLELARQMFISKKAPNISNDPRTAAESIINQHLSIRPKGLPGVAEDLSITHETQYGQSQAPDGDLLDKVNNMVGLGLKVPPTVLNNLNEAEYARSVATSNLFFANNVRGWQAMIKPYNKKFLINYISSCHSLLEEIEKLIAEDLKGSSDAKTVNNTSTCITENQDKSAPELVKKVLSTVELVLAPPNMSTSKAHFEELNAETEAITKLLELIYPDDAAPSDDLKSMMGAVRAMVAAKLVKDFLPKLGIHEIADVPSIEEIDTDQSIKIVQFLANMKRRFEDISKLMMSQLPKEPGAAPAGGDLGGTTPTEGGGDEGNPGGGDDDMGEIPGF